MLNEFPLKFTKNKDTHRLKSSSKFSYENMNQNLCRQRHLGNRASFKTCLPLSNYYASNAAQNSLLKGFRSLIEAEIEQSMLQVKRVIEAM
jgi:hypothetical protein